MTIFKYIKASRFFPKYAPGIKQWNNKRNGHDGYKPITFTKSDLKAIRKGLREMVREGKV